MARRLAVPRASIAVTVLDDPDYIALMSMPDGPAAFGVFVSLTCAAKTQSNGGRFQNPLPVVAVMCRIDLALLTRSVNVIAAACASNRHEPWVSVSDEGVVIRNFGAWNAGHGGKREGAGPPKKQSRCNQDAIKMQSSAIKTQSSGDQAGIKWGPSVSVSVSDSVCEDTHTSEASGGVCDPTGVSESEEDPPIDENSVVTDTTDASTASTDAGWSEFCDAYPRKTGDSLAARRAYDQSIRTGCAHVDIMHSLAVHAKAWADRRTAKTYIPMPENFFLRGYHREYRAPPEYEMRTVQEQCRACGGAGTDSYRETLPGAAPLGPPRQCALCLGTGFEMVERKFVK